MTAGFQEYDMNATLVVFINSFDSLISYIVTLISCSANLRYSHKCTHSDSVPVSKYWGGGKGRGGVTAGFQKYDMNATLVVTALIAQFPIVKVEIFAVHLFSR